MRDGLGKGDLQLSVDGGERVVGIVLEVVAQVVSALQLDEVEVVRLVRQLVVQYGHAPCS